MTRWPGIFAAAIVSSLRYSFPGTVIAGLPAGLTAYGGTQLADRYRAVVVGAGQNLGDWGPCRSMSHMRVANWQMTAPIRGNRCVFCTPNR